MDTYIKYMFEIELALIVIVLGVLYLILRFTHHSETNPTPPATLTMLTDEIIPKLNQIISTIPVTYTSSLNSSDDDTLYDKKMMREIIASDEELTSILPKRKFDTTELLDEF